MSSSGSDTSHLNSPVFRSKRLRSVSTHHEQSSNEGLDCLPEHFTFYCNQSRTLFWNTCTLRSQKWKSQMETREKIVAKKKSNEWKGNLVVLWETGVLFFWQGGCHETVITTVAWSLQYVSITDKNNSPCLYANSIFLYFLIKCRRWEVDISFFSIVPPFQLTPTEVMASICVITTSTCLKK